ncbi:acyltransferase, partial [bacterium]|nr:acyltransferase [bacterium]
ELNIHALNHSELIIGEDCMFSWNITIFSNDGHKMFDKETEKPLSVKSKLVIGNHCWIGYGCIITKNGSLPDNTVVGAGSVVSKKFEKEYTAIAGNPAKVVKEGIKWER